MRVAVTYAEKKKQLLLDVNVDAGATAEAAIKRSGIMAKFPGAIDLAVNKVGLFGKIVGLDQVLQEGDRVEIYRPALGSPPKKDRGEKSESAEEGAAPAARPRPAPRARATTPAAETP